jgi:hypothetical protein
MITWTPLTPSDYWKYEYLPLAYQHQVYLQGLLLLYLGTRVTLLPLDLSRGDDTILFGKNNLYESPTNVIENNLDILWTTWNAPDRLPTVEWLGLYRDPHLLDYTDVNRWFEQMILLEGLITASPQRMLITGTHRTGNNRTRQVLRRNWHYNYILGERALGEKPFADFK